MHISIRTATLEDEGAFLSFNEALSGRELPRDGFARAWRENMQAKGNIYILAEAEGKPVGMGSCHVQWLLHHAEAIAEIQELYVAPGFRSCGVGVALLEALISFAGKAGATQVELSTNRKRLDAHRFYAREGFADTHLKWVKEIKKSGPQYADRFS
ncbi:GNAT family N-acetyltransferase [Ravibacter arvi]